MPAVERHSPGQLAQDEIARGNGGAYASFGGVHWGEINGGLLGATVVYSIVVDPHGNGFVATP